MALQLVVMGPPGAGKGTQAARFARDHGLARIATGDMLREAVASGTPLGRAVGDTLARGALVGDEVMIDLVRERLARPDARRGFVLDGFPRTVPQARALDALLLGGSPLVVVEIQVPDDELVRRVRARRICADCGAGADAFADPSAVPAGCRHPDRCAAEGPPWVARSDDTEEVVRARLEVYRRETAPMVAFYQGRPTFRAIDGARPPEQVRQALVEAVADALGTTSARLAPSPEARP